MLFKAGTRDVLEGGAFVAVSTLSISYILLLRTRSTYTYFNIFCFFRFLCRRMCMSCPIRWTWHSIVYCIITMFFLLFFFILRRIGKHESLTLLEPQSRFGDKSLNFQVVCPQNGTAVLKGLSSPHFHVTVSCLLLLLVVSLFRSFFSPHIIYLVPGTRIRYLF